MLKNKFGENIAIIFVMTATLMMAFQDALVKLMSNDLSIWQLFFIRSLLTILLLSCYAFLFPQRASVLPTFRQWSLLRSSLIILMYVAFYAALSLLDLSVVAATYYTGPIFIALMSFYLAKSINMRQVILMGLGFLGVLIIINPFSGVVSVWLFVPLLSALFYAFAMVLTKIKCQQESPLSLVLSLNLSFVFYSLVALSLIYGFGWVSDKHFLLKPWQPMGAVEWGWLALLAVLNMGIHLFLSLAYQTGKPVVVAGFDYSYLVFAAIWGYLLLGEQIAVNTVIGAVLIGTAGILLLKNQKGEHNE